MKGRGCKTGEGTPKFLCRVFSSSKEIKQNLYKHYINHNQTLFTSTYRSLSETFLRRSFQLFFRFLPRYSDCFVECFVIGFDMSVISFAFHFGPSEIAKSINKHPTSVLFLILFTCVMIPCTVARKGQSAAR